jgi:protein TonB
MPKQALREGTSGVVSFQVQIKDGVVRDVTILSGPRVFHSAVRNAVMQYKCISAGEATASGEIAFKLE